MVLYLSSIRCYNPVYSIESAAMGVNVLYSLIPNSFTLTLKDIGKPKLLIHFLACFWTNWKQNMIFFRDMYWRHTECDVPQTVFHLLIIEIFNICCAAMELKHGEPRVQQWRRVKYSSVPASEESFTSACIRSSTTGNSEKEPSNDQHKMRSFTDAGAGSDSPSESQWPLPHAKRSTFCICICSAYVSCLT